MDGERLPQFRTFQALQENRDRTKQFVIERHPFQRRLNSGRHDVDREHLAAQEIFERINDEHDGGDFQNPERHHRERIGDEELDERRHQRRDDREKVSHRIVWQRDIVVERLEVACLFRPPYLRELTTRPVTVLERVGARHHMDRVYEELGGDARFALVLAEPKQSQAGNHDHRRVRIAQLR